MKGIHPKLCLVALSLSATMVAGCSHNQTAGIPNPFLAPDRVPPPSTRAIAPGTAQPYYPGDPLPVMQSAAPAATMQTVAAAAPIAPANASAAPAAQPKQIAFSNEPSVGVPSDESPLRFELPPPPEPEPMPVANVAPTATAAPNLTPTIAAPASGVVPAIYNAPATVGQPVANMMPTVSLEPEASGPWRSPQIAATTPPAAYPYAVQPAVVPPVVSQQVVQPAVMPGYLVVPPLASLPPSMDVTLRAVPSPAPPLPVESSSPRIRLPGYPAPPVSMTPVPASALGASADGFRPRSSMR